MQMPKLDARPIKMLTRFRKLSEDRASILLQVAMRDVNKAELAREAATRKMDEVSTWKAKVDEQGAIQLAHYEHALGLEQRAVSQVTHAMEAESTASSQWSSAQDVHRLASSAVRVADQRRERVTKALADHDEHRLADEVGDLWLARRWHDLA
jgi:hypothetical protein